MRKSSNIKSLHGEYNRFRIEALNLIRTACGENSVHYQELMRLSKDKEFATHCRYWDRCLGIVEAAMCDFEEGLHRNIIIPLEYCNYTIDDTAISDTGFYIEITPRDSAIACTERQLIIEGTVTVKESVFDRVLEGAATGINGNVFLKDKIIEFGDTNFSDIRLGCGVIVF